MHILVAGGHKQILTIFYWENLNRKYHLTQLSVYGGKGKFAPIHAMKSFRGSRDIKGKGKAVPLQAWRGFQEVKVPRLHNNGTGWWQGCQPYAPAAFTPRKCSSYSFLLEAESTPGP
jgi:hypothetical protein